jgi:hypothetical protein
MAEAAEAVLAGKGWLAAVASGRVVVNPTYRLHCHPTILPASSRLPFTRSIVQPPQKAMIRPRMVPSSRAGALGRGRGPDLAAPAPNAHLELGPMPVGCR